MFVKENGASISEKACTHVKGAVTGNSFAALAEEDNEGEHHTQYERNDTQEQAHNKEGEKQPESTKDWITKYFGKKQMQATLQHSSNSTSTPTKVLSNTNITDEDNDQDLSTEKAAGNKGMMVLVHEQSISNANNEREDEGNTNKSEEDNHGMEIIMHQQQESNMPHVIYTEPQAVASCEGNIS
ncbi:hypothetical protein H5410_046007 [Solanum commersonii]|uniref:Uncharacterized protein n=1 Tax=Solanum commersonii TaxID=4109 RepID=A0A9J5XD67_SOLCO|nr:hypothetical protein H5410_046007 [Solanum commersonii]